MSTMSAQQSGYKFGATYVGSNSAGPGEIYPILVGDIDPSGNLNANIIHQIHPRCNFKFMYKVCILLRNLPIAVQILKKKKRYYDIVACTKSWLT
jgi:mitochondrial import receptor subunit TOM40